MIELSVWIYALGAAALISLISLVGLFIISRDGSKLKAGLSFVVSLAVGALFGSAFLHLLPEAFAESGSPQQVGVFALGGILLFFIIDKYLHWHCHNGRCHVTPLGYKAIVADSAHNLIDGIIIGTSFLVSIELGMVATLAVALHEIPQEIVDFSILLHAGFSRVRALVLNFLSALIAVGGAALALLVGSQLEVFVPTMLAFTAGMFVYLAGTDLIPDLHHNHKSAVSAFTQIVAIVAGIGIMLLL